jgi:AcrR family transcriptional regulator
LNERSCYKRLVPRKSAQSRPRSDGIRSREAILKAAAELATVQGLEGLSIGGLAEHLGISKSGLFAHFGSKEELELATIDMASAIFERDVLDPPFTAPEGVARLAALTEAFLSHVERRVFPGGCFFAAAAAEFDARTGPVRDKIAAFRQRFFETIVELVRQAQGRGELARSADAAQIAFEVDAALLAANAWFVMSGTPEGPARARRSIDAVLLRAAEAAR